MSEILDKAWLVLEIAEVGGNLPTTLTTKELRTLLENIRQLEAENAALRKRVEDAEQNITDMCNALWAILYPDNPEGWEYRTQPIAHIRARVDELEAAKRDIYNHLVIAEEWMDDVTRQNCEYSFADALIAGEQVRDTIAKYADGEGTA